MDFGKKRSEAKLIRVGFRVKASESEQRKTKRDAKNARRAFFVLKQKPKLAAKNFSFFLRKSPYFWGKKLRLLKKGILVGRISSRFSQKPNTPSLHLLCLYNLLGFLGCSLLLGVPPRPDAARRCVPLTGELLLPPVAP